MNFGMITDELNMQETKQVIHSILNAGCEASIVIDRSSFEILYQNDKAIELMGNRVGMICHEVLCTKETPCMDCPMQHIKTQAPLVRERYEELLDGVATWRYHDIAWFDGRDAVLATLVALGDNEQVVMQNMMEQAVKLMDHTPDEVDKLTGISNRIRFYDQTQVAIQDLYNNYAIVLLDIERFKNINVRDRLKMLAKGATSRKIAVAVRRTYVKSSIIKALTDTIMANAPEVGN